jgi:glycosyltransferase involved in cell wall biosynthesis
LKVLLVQAADPVLARSGDSPEKLIQLESLNSGVQLFRKKDVINFVLQWRSLIGNDVSVDTVVISDRKSVSSLLHTGWALRRLIKEKEYDLVHIAWGSSTALTSCLFSSVPTVITFCGSDLLGSYNEAGGKTLNGGISSLCSQVAAIFAAASISVSSNLHSALWGVSKKRGVVIPAGIDTQAFFPIPRNMARKHLRWTEQEKVILFFHGSGAHVKNRPLADKVFASVKRRVPESRLEVVADVDFEKLNIFYNAADVLLLTSFHEGSNNSIKEAMACNLPIVTTDCGDAQERLAHVRPSFVIGSFEPKPIAEAITEILRQGGRSNGREHVADLTLGKIAARIRDVYHSVISN